MWCDGYTSAETRVEIIDGELNQSVPAIVGSLKQHNEDFGYFVLILSSLL